MRISASSLTKKPSGTYAPELLALAIGALGNFFYLCALLCAIVSTALRSINSPRHLYHGPLALNTFRGDVSPDTLKRKRLSEKWLKMELLCRYMCERRVT